MTGRPVPAIGPKDAKIMLVGEAPGEKEDIAGEPFVGWSGKLLNTMLNEAGTSRSECYITNVVNVRPPDNNFEVFYEGKDEPTEELKENIKRLHAEVKEVDPNVIVCLGNEALAAFTGLKGITKRRGSVYTFEHEGKVYKVLPTYHPAAIARMFEWRPVAVMDLGKAVRESRVREYRVSRRDLRVNLGFVELVDELKRLRSGALGPVAFDIETEGRQVNAIAFSDHKGSAVCVPFFFDGKSEWTEEQEVALWQEIKELLEDEKVLKVAQNAQYDIVFLQEVMQIQTRGLWMDTMLAHHVVYPEFPKGLDFLCSMYTDQPYYKADIKTSDKTVFYRYNAMDACVTKEVSEELEKELKDFGVHKFYHGYVHPLLLCMMTVARRGILIDAEFKERTARQYQREIEDLQAKLETHVGGELNVNSPKQMQDWLYKQCGYPKQYKVRKKSKTEKVSTATTDAATLQRLNALRPNVGIEYVLGIRDRKKILSTYLEAVVDDDGRMRTSYNISGTKSGRLSASETIFKTGLNIQNVPKGVSRRMFIPDEGCVFVQMDLSQAEARMVAYLSGDHRLIKLFEEGGDIHRRNAASIFNVTEGEVTGEQRQLAKRIVHASNYGMGPRKFKDTCIEAGQEINEAEAKRLLYKYHAMYPGIHRWHLSIQSQLRKNRTLTTPLGRKRMFFGYLSDDTFRDAYSYIPQSVVADHLSGGVVRLEERLSHEANIGAQILCTVHDSVLVQCPPSQTEKVVAIIKEAVGEGVTSQGRTCKIPMDFQRGANWNDLKPMVV